MQNFIVKPDLSALALISANANRFVYALNPVETADNPPYPFKGKVTIKSLNRVFTKETSNPDFVSGSVLCDCVFAGTNKMLTVWIPIPVFAAIAAKNAEIVVEYGKPYINKQNKEEKRLQLYAPGVEITPAEIIVLTSVLMGFSAKAETAPTAPATATETAPALATADEDIP